MGNIFCFHLLNFKIHPWCPKKSKTVCQLYERWLYVTFSLLFYKSPYSSLFCFVLYKLNWIKEELDNPKRKLNTYSSSLTQKIEKKEEKKKWSRPCMSKEFPPLHTDYEKVITAWRNDLLYFCFLECVLQKHLTEDLLLPRCIVCALCCPLCCTACATFFSVSVSSVRSIAVLMQHKARLFLSSVCSLSLSHRLWCCFPNRWRWRKLQSPAQPYRHYATNWCIYRRSSKASWAKGEVESVFSHLMDRNVCGLRFYAAKDFSTKLKHNHLCYFFRINVFRNIWLARFNIFYSRMHRSAPLSSSTVPNFQHFYSVFCLSFPHIVKYFKLFLCWCLWNV